MILALDLGSTAFKAGLFDTGMHCRGRAQTAVRYAYGSGGQVEIEVASVLDLFRSAILGALSQFGPGSPDIDRISITSQAQTFTVLDGQGRAKTPFISWQDTRAAAVCEAMMSDPGFRDFAAHSSFPELLPGLQLCQLRHIRETAPCLIGPLDRVLVLPAFLIEALGGEAVVDDNLAAMGGLYSLRENDWWPLALDSCGLSTTQLPRIVAAGRPATSTGPQAVELGLREGIPITAAGNDQTAGAFGARLHEADAILVGLGTCQVAYRCIAREPGPAPGIVRGPYPGRRFYQMVVDDYGGNLVRWAETILRYCGSDIDFSEQAAKAEAGCKGLRFRADLGRASGAWTGIGFHHGPPELARSVLEELARRMSAIIRRFDPRAGTGTYLVSGGGRSSSPWIEILSEAVGAELTVTDADPLLGAALMAAEAQ
ncbi:FGGY-family carbohydrate kinase [Verrucomicrobiota bacterium]